MKFLVIGCGSIGRRHIRNLKILGAGNIIACDINIECCRYVEQKYGIKACAELDEALAQEPDVALICTPTSQHIAPALSAAKSGCHLFIEKPLSHSIAGVDELIRMVSRQKVITLVGCNMRFHPGISKIKELLVRESIGRTICARLQAGQYLPDWHPGEDYRKGYSASVSLGGGIILDGIHEIDYITWLMGEVSRVFCFAGRLSSLEIDTEDTAEILLNFKSRAIAEVHLDYVQRAYARSCQVIGEEGTILWDINERQVRLYSAAAKEWQVFPQAADYDMNQMYIDEMKHFLDCLEGRAQPMQDVTAGKKALEVALAAKESAKTGKAIKLEDN
jgi:predicted dehydrogenase